MNPRGISGFAAIFLIIILFVLGYIGYQISRVHFTYGTVKGKVEGAAKLGSTHDDNATIQQLIEVVKESKVQLDPDSIFIDHSIADSFRIYVAYDDSANILGFYTYVRHFVIDEVVPISVQF